MSAASDPSGVVTAQPARPGRKRSEDSRQAILSAAIDIVHEDGYAALSIEAIAKRARTGKQTIYRWWPSKADVVLEAASTLADLRLAGVDQGRLADDMRAFFHIGFGVWASPQMRGMLQVLMAEAQLDDAFAQRFRENFLDRRRRALGRILVRARDRREFTPKVPISVLIDAVLGAVWYRIMAIPAPLDEDLAEQLITLIS